MPYQVIDEAVSRFSTQYLEHVVQFFQLCCLRNAPPLWWITISVLDTTLGAIFLSARDKIALQCLSHHQKLK